MHANDVIISGKTVIFKALKTYFVKKKNNIIFHCPAFHDLKAHEKPVRTTGVIT
jgi:hypothetical protein